MISASSKKTGDDKHWLVMNEQGERFGPVTFETLKLWAQDGRLAPTNTASEDEKTWTPVSELDGLEMDWVAEVSPGAFYGPIHKQALEALKKEGAIPEQAIIFQRTHAGRILSKTQPIPPPPSPPEKAEPSEALQALERQLALERQRAHEIGQQLQQAEIRIATSEAHADTCEKAQKLYAAQTDQAQQQVTAQLTQTHQQLSNIQTQLLAREQELQRHEQRLACVERLEPLLQTCLTKLEHQQQELKSSLGSLPASTTLASEHVEVLVKDILSKLLHNQHELKQSVEATRESAGRSAERVEALIKDDLPKLIHSQQELKQALSTTQEGAVLSAERVERLVKDGFTHLTTLQKESTVEPLLEKFCSQLTSTLNATQEHLLASLSHALTHEVQALSQQFAVQDQALQRVSDDVKTIVPHVTGQITSSVADLLDKGRAALAQRLHADLQEGREHLSEQTQAALTHVQEQLMRATGESQRLAIEYIVRELTTVMSQANQTGREAFLQSVQQGWQGLQQHVVAVESHLKQLDDLQHRLHQELKVALEKQQTTPPPPTVKRTVVEAEAIEVLPPERHHKKAKPSPEAAEPTPPKTEAPPTPSGAGLSMADIEQQARRELERLGAQGMNIFKRKS